MTVVRLRTTIAGFFVLLSLALGVSASPLFHNVNWLWFTVFVGANLFQSGITGWCLMDKILAKLGVPTAEKAGAGCC
jgi:hypothetical protein